MHHALTEDPCVRGVEVDRRDGTNAIWQKNRLAGIDRRLNGAGIVSRAVAPGAEVDH